jgi:eukaryotic-like serine/threonine-protein kinase
MTHCFIETCGGDAVDASPRNAREVFLAAIKLPAEERQAYLREACGDDQGLHQRVAALLQAQAEIGTFHEAPALTVDQPVTESPGTMIGPYKLIEPIGEGGMGTVWLAQQTEPVKRLVALKLIKAGMASKQVLARFEAERQALALMDHPHIARVLDGGTSTTGGPYFVMDLVKGAPITRYCDEHHLTPRQRLELFLPVCQAVQHAHQKGVIHRDLKPSNVLVALYDGRPVPKVIDFGVAKAAGPALTDRTLVTGFGAVVGTLEYMSPEQAELNNLDIDTRSDVYSLGVLLYELLTGSPPFSHKEHEKGGMLEMLRVIREQEPTKPSAKLSTAEGLPTLAANRGTDPAKLTRLVRGELDWIVLKALEKDRNRRYETANGFALDVQRYLADEPVLACPPAVGYRLRKFARRNRSALVTAGLLGLMLLIVAGTLGWTARDRATRRGRNAEAVAALLDQCEVALRTDDADKADLALGAAKRRAADGGAEELASRLARCRADVKLLRALDDADTFRLTWSDGAFPKRRVVAARWRTALADHGVSPDEGRGDDAAGRINGSLVRDRVLTVLDWWLAIDPSPGVRALLQAADPDPYRDTVRDALVARKPVAALAGRPEALAQPARFAVVLGGLDKVAADRRRAVLESALLARPGNFFLLMSLGKSYWDEKRAARQGAASEPVRWFQAALAARPTNLAALNNLGIALIEQGNSDRAVACFREATRLDPRFAGAHFNLGLALRKRGDTEGSIASFRAVTALEPKNAEAHVNLANGLAAKGDLDGAIASFQKVTKINPRHSVAHYHLGNVLFQKGNPDGAIAAYRKAIAINPNFFEAHFNLGSILSDKHDHDGAITAFQNAIRIHPKDSNAHFRLGKALQARGDPDGAIAAYWKAIAINPNFFQAHGNLGAILCDVKHDYDGAATAFRTVIRINPNEPSGHFNLGNVLAARGDLDAAIAAYRRALEIDPNHAPGHHNLGNALAGKADWSGSIKAFREAIRLNPKFALSHFNLGMSLRASGDPDGAIEPFKAAVALNPNRVQYNGALAWVLLTCRDVKRRDPERALALARRAVELAPKLPVAQKTLGIAHYRTGDFKAAVAALEESVKLGDTDAAAHLFLAMSHHKLGNPGEARKAYDRAVRWLERNRKALEKDPVPVSAEELPRFLAEARAVLQMKP